MIQGSKRASSKSTFAKNLQMRSESYLSALSESNSASQIGALLMLADQMLLAQLLDDRKDILTGIHKLRFLLRTEHALLQSSTIRAFRFKS
jgi:hypothetical protein